MLFVDGLGIGSKNPLENPMARFNPRVLHIFEPAAGPAMAGGRVLPTDVRMGVAGILAEISSVIENYLTGRPG